jgi:predicted thioredoxin/glutaredoxin
MIAAGIMSTPAVAVDGTMKVSGRVPNADEIKKWITG